MYLILMPVDFLGSSLLGARFLPALLITSVFGVFGYIVRGVTRSGAVAGAAGAFAIYLGLGFGGFVALFTVFAITWLTTRLGYAEKQQLRIAESGQGRNAGQVLANIGAAAIFSALALWSNVFALAALAALAEAAGDTASSECGEAMSSRAWLITNFRLVPAGTDGGITTAGTTAGSVASLAVALVGAGFRIIPLSSIGIVAVAGFTGTLVDSLLGAALERRGWINNDSVNFLSTVAAAVMALAWEVVAR